MSLMRARYFMVDTQRHVNLACQQGYLSQAALKRARGQWRDEGQQRSLWEVVKAADMLTAKQIQDVESALQVDASGAGWVIEGYRIIERLGSGGMGDVYLGQSDDPQREHDQVAIKILPKRLCADPEHLKRFVLETRALSQLNDQHVTRYISAGEQDSRPYLIMELVRGVSLKEHLQQAGALSSHESVTILAQLSGALIKAEDARVVHRDLKPANILLSPPRSGYDEPFCSKICDFGLVKFLQDRAQDLGVDEALTLSGVALGTPHYMSPEQATGEREIDYRSDMYSLAATVYHAMMGRTLFSGKTSAVIMYKQVTASIDVEPLRQRGCPDELVDLLRDMLRKERHERPSSWRDIYTRATAIVDTLARQAIAQPQPGSQPISRRRASSETLSAGPSPVQGMPRGIFRSRRRTVWAMQLLGLSLVLLVVMLTWLWRPPGDGTRSLRVTPDTFVDAWHVAMQELTIYADDSTYADLGSTRTLILQPGRYAISTPLAVTASGLVLQAAGAGVEIDAGDRPLLDVGADAGTLRIQGPMLIRGRGTALLRVADGAQVFIQDAELRGAPLQVIGGILHIQDSTVGTGLSVFDGGELRMRNSVLEDPMPGLHADGGLLVLERVGIYQRRASAYPTLALDASNVQMRGVRVMSDGADIALRTRGCQWLDLQDVELQALDVAWQSSASTAVIVDGMLLDSRRIGLQWQGPWDHQWQWRHIRARSPQAAVGVQLDVGHDQGPDPAVMAAVPAAPE